ncbi:hypothetical protein HHK36_009879 [Tetracentron sinense]|uniref:Glycosyltransferase n=1 Tax=Tetracentron sinense TaxID=13715 RepID=A0A834ZCK8_TETSI|nr:hypothetical protein HHK36_009879 [Tetracentron sinense]
MGSATHQLHVFFLPLMAHGHMIPAIDMARLFAARGLKVTIITTPLNAPLFSNTIDRDRQLGIDISIRIIRFPSVEAGLPEGCELVNDVTSPEIAPNFFKAINMLQQPLQHLLEESLPDCVVADLFFPWMTDIAAKLGIPRLVFPGTSFFSICVADSFDRYAPHKKVTSDTEAFIVPGLPDQITMTRLQLQDYLRAETPIQFGKMMDQIAESELRAYGVLVNSSYELEPAYAEHYKKIIGRKAWHIGPVSLCNRNAADKVERGKIATIDEHDCLSWLDSKKPNSILYVCFGSISRFSAAQLLEIAMGLEASGHSFIWVVRKETSNGKNDEKQWLPEGFEERMEGKGLIIRGWAPQLLILEHEAIGGFVTHCGWNSTLEGMSAGVPMITWPIFAEQFYNEKLVTQVLKIGVEVGAQEWQDWNEWGEDSKVLVQRDEIKEAVTRLMDGGEEAEQMRIRARELGEKARRAVEDGGSSYTDLTAVIEDLRLYRSLKQAT